MADRLRFEAAPEDAGLRVDSFLAEKSGLSRSAVARILEGGGVILSGRPVKKNHKLSAGEAFDLILSEPEPSRAEPEAIALDVVYEDDDLIVVNKPRGMVVHPAAGHYEGTLVNALLYHCGSSLSGIGGVLRPGIVHRIDKDTSGLILAAKNDFAHTRLAAQIKRHEVSREYEAVVLGKVKQDRGTVDAPVGRHPAERKRMAVLPGGAHAKDAVTHYEVLARYPGYTHIRCVLETGRTHQIRVHMAHLGHPVAGDPVYGPKKDPLKLGGQCLHARILRLTHPRTGRNLEFVTELPPYFQKVLVQIGH